MFVVHGVMQTSNWGGLELELSEDGEAVRVRENYSQTEDKLTCSEWIGIGYHGEDAMFKYNGEDYYLQAFEAVFTK